ncbi:hypothetical protein V6767_14625 [Martelella sp. FLE1502]
MRCILHIGTEKTGTTVLQNWLYLNREALSRSGVYLSLRLGNTNNLYISEYFQSNIDAWAREVGISTLAEKDRFFSGFERALDEEFRLAAEKHDVFLITSEFLHSRLTEREDIRRLAAFLARHCTAVTVICYFREQSSMATSLYSTALLRDCTLSLADYLTQNVKPSRYYYNFEAIADNWSAVFGRSSCDFRIYRRDGFVGNDIRRDFLSALERPIDADALDYRATAENQALMALQAEAMLAINRAVPFYENGTRKVNERNLQLKQRLLAVNALHQGLLGYEGAGEISERFEISNAAFFGKYFDNEAGFSPVPEGREKGAGQAGADLVRELMAALLPLIR